MIRFTDVYMRYAGGKDALKNINLQVEKGEMVYLTGHSGAGKTTLLRLIRTRRAAFPWPDSRQRAKSGTSLGQAHPALPAQYRFHVPGTPVIE